MLPARTLSCVLAACAITGCASASPADDPSARDERRRPDGVAMDPVLELPAPAMARSTDDEVVVLQTPLGVDIATRVTSEFFRSVVREDEEGLARLMSPSASMLAPSPNGQAARVHPLTFWQRRFGKLDYTALSGDPIYREADLEIYRASDLTTNTTGPLGAPVAQALRDVDDVQDSDVVVRVPIALRSLGPVRFFGEDVVLVLRKFHDTYKIETLVEAFTPP